jgi:hypothetical protein
MDFAPFLTRQAKVGVGGGEPDEAVHGKQTGTVAASSGSIENLCGDLETAPRLALCARKDL